jgi:hypothetical protein
LCSIFVFYKKPPVVALCYKPEGRGFEYRLNIFFLFPLIYLILPAANGLRVDSASKGNEYQESSWAGEGGGRPERKADNPTVICELTV